MKKMMMIAMAAATLVAVAAEPAKPAAPAAPAAPQKSEWSWSWWTTSPDNTQRDCRGCVIGFASEVKSMTGAQVSVFTSKAGAVKSGCQFAIGYSRATTLRNGCQLAFFNRSDRAALQFGLLNFNKDGFLPFFPFFNFSKRGFGAAK